MFRPRLSLFALTALLVFLTVHSSAQWTKQTITPAAQGQQWGIAMFDTSQGVSVGKKEYVGPLNFITGIIKKVPGSMVWTPVDSSAFSPALRHYSGTASGFWSGVCALPSGVSFACGDGLRDYHAIYKSADFGATWALKVGGLPTGSANVKTLFDIFFLNDNQGVVVGANGVAYYTADGGTTWSSIATGTTNSLYGVHCAGGVWFLTGASKTILTYVSGAAAATAVPAAALAAFPSAQIEGVYCTDPNTAFFGIGPLVVRTTDGGTSFAALPAMTPAPPTGILTVRFFDQNSGWAAGDYANIYNTTDAGVTWTKYSGQPAGGGSGSITRLSFPIQDIGYASGPLATSQAWILRWTPPSTPDISTSDTLADFGDVVCGNFVDITLAINNSGNDGLSIAAGGIVLPAGFTLLPPDIPPFMIPQGGTQNITVRWTPKPNQADSIASTAKITITSNDGAHSPWTIRLKGRRNYAKMTLGTPSGFPHACINDASLGDIPYTVAGNEDPLLLGFEHVSGDNEFTLLDPPIGIALTGPGMLKIQFTPTIRGNRTGRYRVISGNAACPDTQIVVLTGLGLAPSIAILTPPIDLGRTCAGRQVDREFLIVNNGDVVEYVDAMTLVSGSSLFSIESPTFPSRPLGVGDTLHVQVMFKPGPGDVGVFTSQWTITVRTDQPSPNGCTQDFPIEFRAESVVPMVTVDPQPVDFGPVVTGTVQLRTVKVTNTGTSAINVNTIKLGAGFPSLTILSAPPIPRMLFPGDSIVLTLRYAPLKAETLMVSVSVGYNDPCSDAVIIPVLGEGTAAPKIVVQNTLDLGLQQCSDPIRKTFVIRNIGDGPLQVATMKFYGPPPMPFKLLDPNPPLTLNKGDSVVVTIEFSAAINSDYTAELRLGHNDPAKNYESVVQLHALRQGPAMSVEGDTSTVLTACVGQSQTRQFTIRNTGAGSIIVDTIRVITGMNDFDVVGVTLPDTIPAGGTQTFTVMFAPENPGGFSARIEVRAKPCSLVAVIHLVGQGNQALPLVTPTPIDFGTVQAGGSSQKPVSISNPGSQTIRIERVRIEPPTAGVSFVGAPPTQVDLAAGGNLALAVQYAPTVVGPLHAWLCVEVSSPCPDTICVELLGQAQSSGIALSRSALDLTMDPCSMASSCDTVRLANTSLGTVTVNELSIAPAGGVFRIQGLPSTPFTLASGESRLLTICALPPLVGTAREKLVVKSTDGNTPVLEMPLNGMRDSSRITAAQNRLDFGTLAHCEATKELTLTISNTGTIAENVTEHRPLTAPFTASLPLRLAAGETQQVTVRFTPVTEGDFLDTLWIQTERCGVLIPIECHGAWYRQNASASPTRLTWSGIPVGSNQTKTSTLTNLNVPLVRVERIVILPAGPFSTATGVPAQVDSAGTLPLDFVFAPTAQGPAAAIARVILDTPCRDTIVIELSGTGIDKGLVFLRGGLAFNALAQCETQTLEDTLVNTGSSLFTLTAASFTGTGASGYTLLNPITADEPLTGGAKRIFTIRFTPGPGTDQPVNAQLTVTTTDANQPTMDLPLTGSRRTLRTPVDQTVSVGSVPTGQPAQGQVTLTNTGARAVTYTAAAFPANVSTTPAPPFTIPAGGSQLVTITITPAAAGAFSETAVLRVTAPCEDSTRVTVTGTATNQGGVVRQTSADYGLSPACGVVTRTVTVVNATTKTQRITDIRTSGGDSTNFVVIAPTLPRDVAAGDSVIVTIEFRPASASRVYTTSVVTTHTAGGNDGSVRSTLTAASERALLTAAALPLDAGTGQVGTRVTRVVQVSNTSSLPLIIGTATLTGMTITSTTPALPATVAPNGTLDLTIEWTPQAVGITTDTLVVQSTQPCPERMAFAMAGTGQPADVVQTALAIPVLEGRVDERILIPVQSSADLGGAGTQSWSGAVRFNRTMLHPLRVVKEGSLSADMPTVTMAYDHKTGTVQLSGSGAQVRAGSGPLVYVEALVLVGNALQSPLDIDPAFDFTSGRARVSARNAGVFHLVGYCTGQGNRLVKIDGTFQLRQNHPNPFNPTTDIDYSIAGDGSVLLTVHDALGRCVATLVDEPQRAGEHSVHFDASGLPSGVYHYRLVSGRFTDVRTMIVNR